MESMLDWALAYAKLGWHVLPLHGVKDGHCTCGNPTCGRSAGKHPRIKTGANHAGAATTNEATISGWWKRWPDANIGVMTGPLSGLAVADVDGEAGLDSLDRLQEAIGSIPSTPCSQTGSGGLHFLFSHPGEDHKVVNRAHALGPCLDVRGNGGLFVLPPSKHLSGNEYKWLVPPSEAPLAPFDWLEQAIAWADERREARRKASDVSLPGLLASRPDRDSLLRRASAYLEKMESSIQGCNGSGALWNAAMAMVQGFELDPADALRLLASEFNPRCQPPWREKDLRHKVADVVEKTNSVPRGYLLTSDELVEHGAAVVAAWAKREHEERLAEASEAPAEEEQGSPDILPRCGLIREIVDWILETSIRPQPELAVAAATAFVGTLAGRKFRTQTNLRTGLYLVGLAESGAGKDHARTMIGKLAHAADADGYLGGERIASGPGLITAMRRNASQLFMLDEFGFLLASMTGGRADPHKKDLMATLMTLYSSANKVYKGTEYGDQEKRGRVDLIEPNVAIYGTSTPAQFYAALTSMQGVDGSMARMLVISSSNSRPARQRPASDRPPADLVEAVRDLAKLKAKPAGNLSGLGGTTVDCSEAETLLMPPDVYDAWEQIDEFALDQGETEDEKILWTRVAENVARLALIYAISTRRSEIDVEALEWGARIALWAARTLVKAVSQRVADNEIHAVHNKIARIVREAGRDGISRNDLTRRCYTMRRRDMDEALAMLVQGESIVEVRGAAGPKGGRPITVYRAGKKS